MVSVHIQANFHIQQSKLRVNYNSYFHSVDVKLIASQSSKKHLNTTFSHMA